MSATRLDAVFETLRVQPRRGSGGGRTLMFIAAQAEGATAAAREAALSAGSDAVFAIDLDLRRNALARALSESGSLGPKIDGRLGGVSFCAAADRSGKLLTGSEAAFSYHRVGRSRIYVGAFDGRALPNGARLFVSASPDYWNAVRAGGTMGVIDAPALERDPVGLRVAPHMDGVVLIVSPRPGALPASIAAKEALVSAGANVIGLIYTQASAPVIAADKLLRQAG